MVFNNLTMQHAWWIPAIIIYYTFYTWFSKLHNSTEYIDVAWWKQPTFWYMYIFGALCPFWVIVSKISKNITFDGMLYDNIMFLTFVVTMSLLGAGSKFCIHQWIGVLLIVLGSILMRIEIAN